MRRRRSAYVAAALAAALLASACSTTKTGLVNSGGPTGPSGGTSIGGDSNPSPGVTADAVGSVLDGTHASIGRVDGALDAEFDSPAGVGHHVREAEELELRVAGDDLVHQRNQLRLARTEHDDRQRQRTW